MFNQIFGQGIASPMLSTAELARTTILALMTAFACGQVIAWAYQRTWRGPSFAAGYTHAVVLTSVCAALLMVTIQRSVLAGLGLLAALSMIRFRTTLKSPKDLVYIMAGVTVGTAAGVGAVVQAFVGTAAFVVATFLLHVGTFESGARFDGVLRFRVPAGQSVVSSVENLLNTHCRRFILLSLGEIAQGTEVEHAYQVKFRSAGRRDALIDELKNQVSARDARLLMQDATLEF